MRLASLEHLVVTFLVLGPGGCWNPAQLGEQMIMGVLCTPIFKENDATGNPIRYTTEVQLYPAEASLQPGETQAFEIVRWACCYYPVAPLTPGCVTWAVEPAEAGTIDENGAFRLAGDTQPGEQVVVRASWPEEVPEDTRPDLTATITVYTAASNPLVGTWRERAVLACRDNTETASSEGFEELVFRADGRFTLTWHPFEVYVDYWGTYTHSAVDGALQMRIEGGNYIPQTTDLSGSAKVQDDGSIRLEGVYFGPPQATTREAAPERPCVYVLERR
jgi:hypothetical protein